MVCRGADGFCRTVPLGSAGLMVSEINEIAKFDGYVNRTQSEQKILRVSLDLYVTEDVLQSNNIDM